MGRPRGGVHGFSLGVGSDCLRHSVRATTATFIDPTPCVKPSLGENRFTAREEVVDPISDPLVRAQRAVIEPHSRGP